MGIVVDLLLLVLPVLVVAEGEPTCGCQSLRDNRVSFRQTEAEASLYDMMRLMSTDIAHRIGPYNISFDWQAEDFRRKTGWHDLRAYVDLGNDKSRCFAMYVSM